LIKAVVSSNIEFKQFHYPHSTNPYPLVLYMVVKNKTEILENIKSDLLRNKAEVLLNAYEQALLKTDPSIAVQEWLETNYDLRTFVESNKGKLYLGASGKAALKMTKGFLSVYKDRLTEGLAVVPDNSERYANYHPENFRIIEASHPVPSEKSLTAAKEMLSLAKKAKFGDIFIYLLSGGTSSLLCLPKSPLTLEDAAVVNKELLASSASISEINSIRKYFSNIKGGKLLEAVYPAEAVNLVFSDVEGDSLSTIASGPLHPSSELSESELLDKINTLGLHNTKQIITRAKISEKDSKSKKYGKITNKILKNNASLVLEAKTTLLSSASHPEVKMSEKYFAGELYNILPELEEFFFKENSKSSSSASIGGGEITVSVRGKGLGGRCQEMCLALKRSLEQNPESVFLAAASDGLDGNSNAAGGIVCSETFENALTQGLLVENFLADSNSYGFLALTHSAIITGSTGNNLNDIYLKI